MENEEYTMVSIETYSFEHIGLRLKATELKLQCECSNENFEIFESSKELKDEKGILVNDLFKSIVALVKDDRHDHLFLERIERIDDNTLKLDFGS